MEELNKALRSAFANTFYMYYKAHACHWNVEGLLFSQYHEFFGTIYEEVYSAVDPMAEEIRALGFYAPTTLPELYAEKTIDEPNSVSQNSSSTEKIKEMLASILLVNSSTISSLNKVFLLATQENEQGLADFIAGRIDAHKKHEWMIKSSLKN